MKNTTTRDSIDNDFLRGYLDAALFTEDENAPGGCDYIECGRADEMYATLPADFVEQARKDCARFWADNGGKLAEINDPLQAGADFWYDRNGHGCGARDRGYGELTGLALAESAKRFGEVYVELELTNAVD